MLGMKRQPHDNTVMRTGDVCYSLLRLLSDGAAC
jgi:hypothetical protein